MPAYGNDGNDQDKDPALQNLSSLSTQSPVVPGITPVIVISDTDQPPVSYPAPVLQAHSNNATQPLALLLHVAKTSSTMRLSNDRQDDPTLNRFLSSQLQSTTGHRRYFHLIDFLIRNWLLLQNLTLITGATNLISSAALTILQNQIDLSEHHQALLQHHLQVTEMQLTDLVAITAETTFVVHFAGANGLVAVIYLQLPFQIGDETGVIVGFNNGAEQPPPYFIICSYRSY